MSFRQLRGAWLCEADQHMSYLIFACVVVAIFTALGGVFVWLVSAACSFLAISLEPVDGQPAPRTPGSGSRTRANKRAAGGNFGGKWISVAAG